MFERYTEKARRVVFFARYEASQFGSSYIESEHLLLGLLREDKALANRFLRDHAAVGSIRKQIEEATPIGEKVSTAVDLPLSNECKRILFYAAEEAELLAHKHIGTEHILLGILREKDCLAEQLLRERGMRLEQVRESMTGTHRQHRDPRCALECRLRPAAGKRSAEISLDQSRMESARHPGAQRERQPLVLHRPAVRRQRVRPEARRLAPRPLPHLPLGAVRNR
jgi:ATP-dependent Clp protease ATP-binding subunit ClpC